MSELDNPPTAKLEPVKLCLLLVDDQEESTQQFKNDLISLGYDPDVIQIQSRAALVNWLTENHTCDVVIANHRVKDFAAVDVMAVLREMNLTSVPVVLLTDGTKDEEIGPLIRLGATGFITLREIKNLVPLIEKEIRNRKELNEMKEALAKTAQKREEEISQREAVVATLEELRTDAHALTEKKT